MKHPIREKEKIERKYPMRERGTRDTELNTGEKCNMSQYTSVQPIEILEKEGSLWKTSLKQSRNKV